jgi:NAD(P)-dependent dehydrogenase (short-subunit alcohol dehydrogenase family)/acyl carrier protein
VAGDEFYRQQESRGYALGPAFRWIENAFVGENEAMATLRSPETLKGDLAPDTPHPGLLDSCLQLATRVSGVPHPEAAGAWVPYSVEGVTFAEHAFLSVDSYVCHVERLGEAGSSQRLDARLQIVRADGTFVAGFDRLRLRWITAEQIAIPRSVPSEAFYRVEWQRAFLQGSPRRESERYLVVGDDTGLGRRVVDEFERRGHVAGLSSGLPAEGIGGGVRGVVCLACSPGEAADPLGPDLQTAVDIVQGVIGQNGPKLWMVTRGAQCTGQEQRMGPAAGAAVWGLGRVLASEHPDLFGGLIDLGVDVSGDELVELVDEIVGDDAEREVALRVGHRLVPRMVAHAKRKNDTARVSIRSNAPYLITGGTGALGLAIAQWLVEQGARHLVLVARRSPGDSAAAAIDAMRAAGADVRIEPADVANHDEVEALMERLRVVLPPIAGVVHAAGIIEDRVLARLEWSSFSRVLAPKVNGIRNIEAHLDPTRLDFLVSFSSTSALLGNQGQANYAAANAVLDAYAHRLRARRVPAISIAWGPWRGGGMSATVGDALADRWGLVPIEPQDGARMFGDLLGQSQAYVIAAEIDASALRDAVEGTAHRPLVSSLLASSGAPDATHDSGSARRQVLPDLAALDDLGRREAVLGYLAAVVKAMVGLDPSARLTEDDRFEDQGVDSLLALDLIQMLRRELGVNLPGSAILDCPTLGMLTDYLLVDLASTAGAEVETAGGRVA